jgi:hypothetical protein
MIFNKPCVLEDSRGEVRTFDNPAAAAQHARECVKTGRSVLTGNPVSPQKISLIPIDEQGERAERPARYFY